MKRSEMPVGSVVTIGHPANGKLAVKSDRGWRWVSDGWLLIDEDEDFRAGWDVYAVPSLKEATG